LYPSCTRRRPSRLLLRPSSCPELLRARAAESSLHGPLRPSREVQHALPSPRIRACGRAARASHAIGRPPRTAQARAPSTVGMCPVPRLRKRTKESERPSTPTGGHYSGNRPPSNAQPGKRRHTPAVSGAGDLLTCPECGAEVQPAGRLGTGQFVGPQEPRPEPWRDVAPARVAAPSSSATRANRGGSSPPNRPFPRLGTLPTIN